MAIIHVPKERIPVEPVKILRGKQFKGIFEYKDKVEYIGLFEKPAKQGEEPRLLRVLGILRSAKYFNEAKEQVNSEVCPHAHAASEKWRLPETNRAIVTIKDWVVNPDPADLQKYPSAKFFGGKISWALERAIVVWYNNPKREPVQWATTAENGKRSSANWERMLVLTDGKRVGDEYKEMPYNEFKKMQPI